MTAPKGLGNAGRALWHQIVRALPDDWEFDDREQAILAVACRQRDDIGKLEKVIQARGVMSVGSAGQPVCHPAVAEVRQGRLALGRLLGQLHLPDEEGEPRTLAGKRNQAAAETRWRNEQKGTERGAA
jgi:Phage terminase, small subunit